MSRGGVRSNLFAADLRRSADADAFRRRADRVRDPPCSAPRACPRTRRGSSPTSLVGANLRGHDSHGVMRVPQYVDFLEKGDYRTGVDCSRSSTRRPPWSSATASGASARSRRTGCSTGSSPRPRRSGIAAGAARDCGHIGRLGEYAERAAGDGPDPDRHGQQLRRRPARRPAGRHRAPARHQPALRGGPDGRRPGRPRLRHERRRRGEGPRLPHQQAARPRGLAARPARASRRPTRRSSTTPPLGSILPMGGAQAYKGFGLGLVLDMLAGGLTGGRSSHPGAPPAKGNNVVFLALDPARFAGRDALLRESTAARRLRPRHAPRPGRRRDPPARRPRDAHARASGRPRGSRSRTPTGPSSSRAAPTQARRGTPPKCRLDDRERCPPRDAMTGFRTPTRRGSGRWRTA